MLLLTLLQAVQNQLGNEQRGKENSMRLALLTTAVRATIGQARAKFAAAIRECIAVVEPFIHAFSDAYQTHFPQFAPTRGEVIGRFVKANKLSENVGGQIAAAWDADGSQSAGDTLAGLANAATRVSQLFSFNRAEVVEAAAGRVVVEGWDAIS